MREGCGSTNLLTRTAGDGALDFVKRAADLFAHGYVVLPLNDWGGMVVAVLVVVVVTVVTVVAVVVVGRCGCGPGGAAKETPPTGGSDGCWATAVEQHVEWVVFRFGFWWRSFQT